MSLAGVSVAGEDEIDAGGTMEYGLLLDDPGIDKVTTKIIRNVPKIRAETSGKRPANRLCILILQRELE